MTALPHLTRRDGVYYWRRKSRRLSTGSIDLRVSLRTTDRSRAITLARVLSADSETIMPALEQSRITLDEAKRYLHHVVRSHTENAADLRRNLRLRYGVPSCDMQDRFAWAKAKSWELLARMGTGAAITETVEEELIAQGRDAGDIQFLGLILEQIIKPGLTSVREAKDRAMEFERVNGRAPASDAEDLQLLELHIEGKRAAQTAIRNTSVEVLAAEVVQEMNPTAPPLPVETAPAPRPPSWQAAVVPLRPEPAAILAVAPTVPSLDPSISAVIDRMIECKRHDDGGFEEKTARQYQAFGALLQRVIGKADVTDLVQADVVKFRAALFRLPKSFGKSPTDHIAPIEEILAKAAILPKEKVGMAVGTINRYIDQFSALVNSGKSEGLDIDPKLAPGSLRRKERVRQRDKKRTFTRAELQTLFQHAFWTNEDTARSIPPLDQRRLSGLYWVPLICAYTGMRREEISGFSPEHFKKEDGIWYFELVPTSTRRLKTAASARRIPVHADLISLGLCDVVQLAQKKCQSLLFPDLQEPSAKILGRKVGRVMERMITEIWGAAGEGLSLQSARHYVQHVLDLDKSVPEKVSREIMGHEGTDVHSSVYGDQCPITDLKDAIDRLPSLINLPDFPRGRIG